MSSSSGGGKRALLILLAAGVVLVGIVVGGRRLVEGVVHDYILEHPEILPQAMDNLARKEGAKQIAGIRAELEKPFPGAVLGNPLGKVTLVEFSDYACGYCRQSVPEVEALIAEHPDLRVVVRELPILSPESAEAAKWALAAAEQGKYAAFHNAMFAAGRPDAMGVQAAAAAVRLDMARAKAVVADPRTEAELKRNYAFAQRLGFNGTPSWVAGDQILSGAVGRARLTKAIPQAKGD